MPLSVVSFFAAAACWGSHVGSRRGVTCGVDDYFKFYPTSTPSTRPSKLVIQQEMAYIFSVLLLVVGQIGRAAVGAARGIKLGRRRQRRVVDAPLLPGHEVVQEPVEVVREVRVVLDLVVRAQAAERGAVQVLASRTVPAQGLAFFSVHELDGDRLR